MRRALILLLFVLTGCTSFSAQVTPAQHTAPAAQTPQPTPKAKPSTPREKLIAAALEQVGVTKEYDPAYVKLAYPNGDVPMNTGVCADVIVRAFRQVGLDLQKELHEDMKRNFGKYPKKWGTKAPDSNIDHRRVPNLMTWFDRQGKALPLSDKAEDYSPGDVVAWNLSGGLTHIGLVSDQKAEGTNRYLIVHNIGTGAQHEDRLLEWKVIGRYRYFTDTDKQANASSIKDATAIKVKVLLSLLFKETGAVEVLKTVEISPATLPDKTKKRYEEKAIAEAVKLKFTPARKDGKPVAVRMARQFSFDHSDTPHETQ